MFDDHIVFLDLETTGGSAIYDRIRRGDFPSSVSIGARAVAWPSSSIAEWQTQQIERSRKAAS